MRSAVLRRPPRTASLAAYPPATHSARLSEPRAQRATLEGFWRRNQFSCAPEEMTMRPAYVLALALALAGVQPAAAETVFVPAENNVPVAAIEVTRSSGYTLVR